MDEDDDKVNVKAIVLAMGIAVAVLAVITLIVHFAREGFRYGRSSAGVYYSTGDRDELSGAPEFGVGLLGQMEAPVVNELVNMRF